MTDTTNGQLGDFDLDKLEEAARRRLAAIEARLVEARREKTALGTEIKTLVAERERAQRMVPRPRRAVVTPSPAATP